MKIDKNIIKELTDYLNEFNLTEIEYTDKDTKIKVSKSNPASLGQVVSVAAQTSTSVEEKPKAVSGTEVKSPIIGTAYHAPEPGAKKFSEMIETAVNKYHNNQIDSAQVLEELSAIAQEMRIEDNKASELGLSEEEYAFYSVLNQNDSTKMLDDHKMKELVHHIVDVIRKNATVDWSKRSDVRAKLRLTVRKTLMKYGYPPDLARMEADRVIEQSEALAETLTR